MQFCQLRYLSRRNPAPRQFWSPLRMGLDQSVQHPRVPAFLRSCWYRCTAALDAANAGVAAQAPAAAAARPQ